MIRASRFWGIYSPGFLQLPAGHGHFEICRHRVILVVHSNIPSSYVLKPLFACTEHTNIRIHRLVRVRIHPATVELWLSSLFPKRSKQLSERAVIEQFLIHRSGGDEKKIKRSISKIPYGMIKNFFAFIENNIRRNFDEILQTLKNRFLILEQKECQV